MVFSKFSTAFVLATVLAAPLAAQDHKIILGVNGGLVKPIAELGQVAYPLSGGTGYRHFNGGINVGANAIYMLDPNLGLRVDGTYSKATVHEPLVGCMPECSTGWTKMFASLDIMLRASNSGLVPFGYFGAGIAKMSESGSGRKATRPTARVGAGVNFAPSNSPLGFTGELGLMVYDFDQTKFTFYDKVQTDLALKVGISYGL